MLSKNMYEVLSCFPRNLGKHIKYDELLDNCILSKDDIDECLNETLFSAWNYVRSSNGFKTGSDLYITESGLAKVEAHEQSVKEYRIVKTALWVSVISAIVAFISLIKMFL